VWILQIFAGGFGYPETLKYEILESWPNQRGKSPTKDSQKSGAGNFALTIIIFQLGPRKLRLSRPPPSSSPKARQPCSSLSSHLRGGWLTNSGNRATATLTRNCTPYQTPRSTAHGVAPRLRLTAHTNPAASALLRSFLILQHRFCSPFLSTNTSTILQTESGKMDPVSPGRLWSLVPQGDLDQDAARTAKDFSWTCGNDPHIYHITMISRGAYGQVHKVLPFGDIADS